MSRLYFQEEAELFAHKAWNTLGLELPVDLGVVASRLGVEVYEREFIEQIDGFYLRLPDAPPIIAINSSYIKPPTRRRFTLAHELGHHLLGRRLNPGKRLFFLDTASTGRGVLERACDRFAALLLMPDKLVSQHFEQLAYNPENRIRILSERFGVSAWAMRRRLREMGLEYRSFRRRNLA